MAKLALLIGVSEYQNGLTSLPSAVRDVEAMQRVLHQPDTGGFDQVKPLIDPDPLLMQQEIEALFCDRSKDDLVLLFFSGHGIKDDTGKLYFATRITRKTPKGELIRSTAVPASFVCEIMGNSRSKRQIVILDCCFSGAFAEDMTAKDDGSVSVQAQLGGEGRAVLTSSTSTQYSFEQKDSDLSIYTEYLVKGIETGEADLDADGVISVDELHDYARQHVQETAPAMKPEIYAVREGFRIRLAKARISDPKLRYRKAVEQAASGGKIFPADRRLLNHLQTEIGLSIAEASAIEVEVLQAYWDYQDNLEQYRQILEKALQCEYPLSLQTQRKLEQFQTRWNLKPEDVAQVEAQLLKQLDGSELAHTSKSSERSLNLVSPTVSPTANDFSPAIPTPPPTEVPIPDQVEPLPVVPPPKEHTTRFGWILAIALIVAAGAGYGGFQLMSQLSGSSGSSNSPSQPTETTPTETCVVNNFSGTLNIRSGPSGQSAIINALSAGQQATATGEEINGWIKISAPVAGWIFKDYTRSCSIVETPPPTPDPSPSPLPSPSVSVSPSPSPSPSPAPPTPAIRPAPDQFVTNYFTNINSRNFQQGWAMLSTDFQQEGTGGYPDYYQWWSSVARTEVLEATPVEQTSDLAKVNIRVKYFLKTGVCKLDVRQWILKWDPDQNMWLLNHREWLSEQRNLLDCT